MEEFATSMCVTNSAVIVFECAIFSSSRGN